MTPTYRRDNYALAYLHFDIYDFSFWHDAPDFLQFNLFTPTACSGCPLFDIATNKAMGQYQTSNSRLKRDSRKRIIFIWFPSFFCQRDFSRRAGISKQQAYGTERQYLRTVDKSRPAVWKANRQKKGGVCSHCDFHFDMRYDHRFDMTAKIWPSFW